ncbi:MAG: DNA repair protein RecO [Candidatus Nealsonbacteria bacterium]|nr:DNA repair protein RecO [Candidatus Nealsonbacteria bacterium]
MSDFYRSPGFVIAKNDLREADQLFSFFSRDFGKVEILGRAVRKIRSKLRAGVDLIYFSELEFIQGKAYKTLTDSSVIEKFKNIRSDLNKLEIAHRICETSDTLIRGQEKDDGIYNLLDETLKRLNNGVLNQELIYYHFFWNFVSLLGYQMDLYDCPLCQNKLTPDNLYFNPEEGAVACCAKKDVKIYPEVVKIVRFLTENDWDMISKLRFERQHLEYLEDLSLRYLGYIKGMTHCV